MPAGIAPVPPELTEDEEIDALAEQAASDDVAELTPEDFDIRPVSGGAPLRSGDGSIVDDEQEAEIRRWYRAHPVSEFNAIRSD